MYGAFCAKQWDILSGLRFVSVLFHLMAEVQSLLSSWTFWSFPSPLPSSGVDDRTIQLSAAVSPKSSQALFDDLLTHLEQKLKQSASVEQTAYWMKQLEHLLPQFAKQDPQLSTFDSFENRGEVGKTIFDLLAAQEMMPFVGLRDNLLFFRDFTVTVFAEENVDFLEQIDKLQKSVPGSDEEKAIMTYIIGNFLGDVPKPINVTFDKVEPIMEAQEAGELNRELFDCVRDHIIQLTFQNCWREFTESTYFTDLVNHKLKLPVPSLVFAEEVQADNVVYKKFIVGLAAIITRGFAQLVRELEASTDALSKAAFFSSEADASRSFEQLSSQLTKDLQSLQKSKLHGLLILKIFDQVFAKLDGNAFNHLVKNVQPYANAERGAHIKSVHEKLKKWQENNLGNSLASFELSADQWLRLPYLVQTASLLCVDKEELTDDDVLKALFPLDREQQWHILSHFEPADNIPEDVKESFTDAVERNELKVYKPLDDVSAISAKLPPLPTF